MIVASEIFSLEGNKNCSSKIKTELAKTNKIYEENARLHHSHTSQTKLLQIEDIIKPEFNTDLNENGSNADLDSVKVQRFEIKESSKKSLQPLALEYHKID